MQRVTLGSSGLEVSRLAIGTGTSGWGSTAVYGRRRVPFPPARMTARMPFMGTDPSCSRKSTHSARRCPA